MSYIELKSQASQLTPEYVINGMKYIVCMCLWHKRNKLTLKHTLKLFHKLKPEYLTEHLVRWIQKADRLVEWLFLPENRDLWKRERVPLQIRGSPEYLAWRLAVLERDNWMCQDCGGRKELVVHHIKPYRDYKDLRLDVNNGATLCHNCHIEAHRCLN